MKNGNGLARTFLTFAVITASLLAIADKQYVFKNISQNCGIYHETEVRPYEGATPMLFVEANGHSQPIGYYWTKISELDQLQNGQEIPVVSTIWPVNNMQTTSLYAVRANNLLSIRTASKVLCADLESTGWRLQP